MTEKTMGEIYLEPEEEIIKNAKEIAVESQTAEKYIFCISYEATEKSVVLSEIKRLECEILEQSDTKTCVTVKASMAQLAAIKSLNCIEKVEMADDYSATTTENVSEIMTANELEATEFTEHVSLAAMEEEAISTMCYGGDSGSDCDNSNTMQTAYYLPISSWVNGCICCPGTEIWYRFTASASNAAEYTIYTSGSLDTMGYLYSSNGTLITSNDDGGGSLNFSITEELTYGATYYVKVKAYGSNTGNYDIRVGYTTQSSSGGQDDSDCSNDQASAIQLTLNSWQSDEICCPGAEMWYKFTPSTTAYYTVYTVGSLDTVGHIYDADCNQLDSDDDDGTGLNFRMVARLTAGQTYYVKVSAYGSNTGYFSIAITNTVFVEYVSIDQGYIALDKGKTQTLTATVSPSYATNKTLRWETGDASVATVNQDGVVTARGAGTTCICAYSQDGSNKSSCCEVSVNVPVESVTINTSLLLMRVGEYDYLYAEVCPTDAVNKLIRWSSTNTGVVWVNEATGRVEARGVGSATIYATAQDGTGIRGSCAIQVEPPIAVQGIDICCDNYTMNVGETTYLSYDIYPADATNKNVTWCSSNPSVAEVDASTGRITTKKAGATTITATTDDGSFVASCEVRVIIDTVTITRDEGFNKVIFHSSGKVWRCINHDLVFDNDQTSNTTLIYRSNHNFYRYFDEDNWINSDTTSYKEYTDDEIRLLYAIDPYGVADYVNRFAATKGELADILREKDRVFKILFGREPNYFIQMDNGAWQITQNKSNLRKVISESESYFGMHSVLDFWDVVINFIDTLTDFLCMMIPSELVDDLVEISGTLLKIGILCYNEEYYAAFEEFKSYLSSGLLNPEDKEIESVFDVLTAFSSLNELLNSLSSKPSYYGCMIDYCINKVDYDVYLKLSNNDIIKLEDIQQPIE